MGVDQERRLLLSFMQDQAAAAASASSRPAPEAASSSGRAPQGKDSKPPGHYNAKATVSLHNHSPEAAAATQSSHASLHAGANHSSLQRSVSDCMSLPGSLRQRFAVSIPAQHASSAWSTWCLQPGPLKAESSQTASASQAMCADGATHRHHSAADVIAQAEPSTEAHSAVGSCKVEIVSSASESCTLYQNASMPIATSNGWHLRASSPAGAVSRRKNHMYTEQQAYWQKKEALCPTIKNCIQEVQQLRAQLSANSQQL